MCAERSNRIDNLVCLSGVISGSAIRESVSFPVRWIKVYSIGRGGVQTVSAVETNFLTGFGTNDGCS